MSNVLTLTATEEKIAERLKPEGAKQIAIRESSGGVAFANMSEVMEFAKYMALGNIAVPKHLRGNPGACLAVTVQAVEWRMSPFAVARKSYSVNDQLSFESQLIQAVILQRAPIRGRFAVSYLGEGSKRRCKVVATLADGTGTVEYETPEFDKIQPKNSPLWKTDPDQQQFYYAGRALCRRHFPDVLLGVYDRDEVAEPIQPGPRGGTSAALSDKLDRVASGHGQTIEGEVAAQEAGLEEDQRQPEERDEALEDDRALLTEGATEAEPEDSPERTKLLANLRIVAVQDGIKKLRLKLGGLTAEEQKLVTERDREELFAAAGRFERQAAE